MTELVEQLYDLCERLQDDYDGFSMFEQREEDLVAVRSAIERLSIIEVDS